MILAVSLALAGMPSCSCDHPEFIHLDFADMVYVVGPTMGEKASGHYKIDSSILNRELYFLVNESNPKCYAKPVIEKFIDTNRLIREEIAKRYYELRVHFYHRGDNTVGDNTDELLKSRTTKPLVYFENDIISEYVWRDGRQAETLFYDHGQIMDGQDIKLEDMRKKNNP
jgi:hypothetical protein